jgi:hypothetical protein
VSAVPPLPTGTVFWNSFAAWQEAQHYAEMWARKSCLRYRVHRMPGDHWIRPWAVYRLPQPIPVRHLP